MTQQGISEIEVFIIGGGPVGMAMASELTRYGVRCRIVDKRPGPIDVTHACVLWSRTQEVLAAMGIRDMWLPHALEQHQLIMYGYGKRLGTIHYDVTDTPYPIPLLVGQNTTERLFIEHLQSMGVTVERPVEATLIEPDAQGVTVTLRHADGSEELVRTNWLIACEGSKSIAREALGIPFEGERYEGIEFVQADCGIRWSRPRGWAYYFLSERNFMATLPLPLPIPDYDRIRVFIARKDLDPTNRSEPTLEEIQEIVREVAAEDAELSNPVWLSRVRVQRKLAERYREGRVLLAGDTCHVHVPMGGQGMNTGIQDAFNLSWKLAYVIHGLAPESLLDSYMAERRPVAQALLKGTDLTFRSFSEPGAIQQHSVQLLGPFAFSLDIVTKRIVTTLSELEINYKASSPIIEEHRTGNGPAAGERAPDATIVTLPNKETTTLFDLMKGTQWTLLLLSGHNPTPQTLQHLADIGSLIEQNFAQTIKAHLVVARIAPPTGVQWSGSAVMDTEEVLHSKYGVSSPSFYLIRPDGYVGYRGPLSTKDNLLAYLKKMFSTMSNATV